MKKFIIDFQLFENLYRSDAYELGDFLKQCFPNVKFEWDEDSKGWWTTDDDFVNIYSSHRTSYNGSVVSALKRKHRLKKHNQKLIVNSDFDRIQITLD